MKAKILKINRTEKKSQNVLLEGWDKPIWVKRPYKNFERSEYVVGDEIELYEKPELDDFWKDVDSRVGMDVCTPFIERFRGHSFVVFDNGLIWSKTLKRGFRTRNASISFRSYPKAMKHRPYGFGADLSELDKIVAS